MRDQIVTVELGVLLAERVRELTMIRPQPLAKQLKYGQQAAGQLQQRQCRSLRRARLVGLTIIPQLGPEADYKCAGMGTRSAHLENR
jgi:hypothetical protein